MLVMGNTPDKYEDESVESRRVVTKGLRRNWVTGRRRAKTSGAAMKYGYSVEVLVRSSSNLPGEDLEKKDLY